MMGGLGSFVNLTTDIRTAKHQISSRKKRSILHTWFRNGRPGFVWLFRRWWWRRSRGIRMRRARRFWRRCWGRRRCLARRRQWRRLCWGRWRSWGLHRKERGREPQAARDWCTTDTMIRLCFTVSSSSSASLCLSSLFLPFSLTFLSTLQRLESLTPLESNWIGVLCFSSSTLPLLVFE